MSAAANAAGYLYMRGQLPLSDHATAAALKTEQSPAQPGPRQLARTPVITYRKRRLQPASGTVREAG